jgi:hypothetical protein
LDTDRTFYKTLNGVHPRLAYTDYRYPGVGRWTKHLDPLRLEPCFYGYHYTDEEHLVDWLGETIYTCEPCPYHEPYDGLSKLVTCRLKLVHRFDTWTPRVQRLFAVDCAEHVGTHGSYSDIADPAQYERIDWALNEAREFVNGNRDRFELRDARLDMKHLSQSAFSFSVRSKAVVVASAMSTYGDPVEIAMHTAREARQRAVFGMQERRWQATRLVEYLEGRR